MKIMLAVDGSMHASSAEAFLARLAGRRAHRVEVLYVTPPFAPGAGGGEKTFPEVLAEGGVKMLDHIVLGLKKRSSFRVWPRLVKSLNVPEGILRAAEKEKADLVVLGSRGLTKLDIFLLGSVSQQVTRHAKGGVLVVRGAAKAEEDGPVKVLAAVDGSRPGRDALALLRELAAPGAVDLTLLHVVESPMAWVDPYFGAAMEPTALRSYQEEMDRLRAHGRRLLAETRRRLAKSFGRIDVRLVEGPAAGAILDAARSGGYGLLVVGTRGMSAAKRFLLGSVSQKVLAHAPCPVLMAPARRKP